MPYTRAILNFQSTRVEELMLLEVGNNFMISSKHFIVDFIGELTLGEVKRLKWREC